MKNENNVANLKLDAIHQKQIHESLALLNDVFSCDLLGVYLYGSAVAGGLQRYSDLDLFVVLKRASTSDEKKKIIKSLLTISGIYMKSEKRPIEMTIVEHVQINPWHYPPRCDFQYGEWLREQFEQGNNASLAVQEMPDLALLVTQVLLANVTLMGAVSAKLLCPVPYKDFIAAMADALPSLLAGLDGDIRNVLLTLARIWSTVETCKICSKPDAADWAIERLPEKYQPVLMRAKAICVGEENEHWDDIQDLIKPCADFMHNKAHEKMAEIVSADNCGQVIKAV